VERFQRVPRPEGRDAPDWAAKLHLAEAPVYYQNYVLGELIASQLKTWLRRETGGHFLESRRSGELLVSRFFAPGARMAWMDLVRHATGEALDARFFMEEFVRGS
jgi:peptidyl-dipeptidase A